MSNTNIVSFCCSGGLLYIARVKCHQIVQSMSKCDVVLCFLVHKFHRNNQFQDREMIGHYTEESETRGSLFCIPNDDSAVLFPSTHRFQTLVRAYILHDEIQFFWPFYCHRTHPGCLLSMKAFPGFLIPLRERTHRTSAAPLHLS